MRCHYCKGDTENPEYLNGRQIYVCDRLACQQEFWEGERDQRDRDNKYDDWRLRSE